MEPITAPSGPVGRQPPHWLPPKAATLLIVLILAGGAVGAVHLQIVEDVTSLLPGDGDRRSFRELSRELGLMKTVVFSLSAKQPNRKDLSELANELTRELSRLGDIKVVRDDGSPQRVKATAKLLAEHFARLPRRDTDSLDHAAIVEKLSLLKNRLAAPESIALGELMLSDPLGLSKGALTALERALHQMGAVAEEGHLWSRDKNHLLVLTQLTFNPMEIARSQALLEQLDDIAARLSQRFAHLSPEISALGGIHYAVHSATVMRRDIAIAFAVTVIGLLGVFLLLIRRLRLLPAALLPSGLGIGAGFAVMALLGEELHALTLGFAASIAGISIDYAIHVIYAALEASGTSQERMSQAIRTVRRPALSACITTLAAFALIATSGFPGIRQLALFSTVAIPVALAASFFVLPAFHRLLLSQGRPPSRRASLQNFPLTPRGRGIAGLVIIAIAGVGLGQLEFSGDPRRLGPPLEALRNRQSALAVQLPGMFDQAVLVAIGPSTEIALQRNDTLYQELQRSQMDVDQIISLSPILPSLKTQQIALTSNRRLFDDSKLEAFQSAGFTAAYFHGLQRQVESTQPLESTSFANTALEAFITASIRPIGDETSVITRIQLGDTVELERLREFVASLEGITILSERLQTQGALERLQREFVWMIGLWLVTALVGLSIIERSVRFGLKAAMPAFIGVAASLGLMGLLGRPLTPVATAGAVLVLGLGIDYGIFALHGARRRETISNWAIIASAATTLAAFGGLSLAQTRAMSDMGTIILVGVAAALLTAISGAPSTPPKE